MRFRLREASLEGGGVVAGEGEAEGRGEGSEGSGVGLARVVEGAGERGAGSGTGGVGRPRKAADLGGRVGGREVVEGIDAGGPAVVVVGPPTA